MSIGNMMYYWSIGNMMYFWSIGNMMYYWSIGNMMYFWSIGNMMYFWSIGRNVSMNIPTTAGNAHVGQNYKERQHPTKIQGRLISGNCTY